MDFGYAVMAMVMAHPCAAGVQAEAVEPPPPRNRKPPRGGRTMRVERALPRLRRLEAAVAAAG